MKFIHYLEKIAGVDVLGLVSLFIFFVFFIGVLIWVFKADKKYMEEMNELPLKN